MSRENVEYLRSLVLPRIREALDVLHQRFPDVDIQAMDSEIGSLTDYQGYSLGIDCDLVQSSPPTSVALEIGVKHYLGQDAEIDSLCVVWGPPDASTEIDLLEKPLPLTRAACERVAAQFEVLLIRLREALERRRSPR